MKMLTKKKDKRYCGVRPAKLKEAKPVLNETNFKHLYYFIVRRYMIHKRKDVLGLPAPWTKDPILQDFKFTNVRREHDRETKWLLDQVVNNEELDYDNKIMNCILYRMYNKSSTLELVYAANNGHTYLPIQFDGFDAMDEERIRRGLKEKLKDDPKYTFFTNAFLTCGLKVALGNQDDTNDSFMPMRIIKFARKLYEDGIVDKIKKAKDQKEVFNAIKSYNGLGEFLSYQIFVDLTYIPEFPFSENEFTISGPGCIRGLKAVFEDFDGMTYDEALFWLRDNIDVEFTVRGWKWEPHKLFDDLPEHDRYMNVMSLENCHCEISKYIRAVEGTGRPKNRYKGRG
jgi:hypothetical protein